MAVTFAPGTRLGPYEIVAPIGAGGTGEVFRAREVGRSREVALKVLRRAWGDDAEQVRRFEQEALAAGALSHPGIAEIFDAGFHDGSPYVVSELLDGRTLRARLKEGPLAAREATDVALQLARGLAAAHDKGIVHSDLKPENVFLTWSGQVKILDFGLAQLAPRPEDGATIPREAAAVNSLPGSYAAPEQVRGQPPDARSDIFAVGAMLYEMLSGRKPFRRETPAETMAAILGEEPPELPETDEDASGALARIVKRCLEKRPEDRVQSACELAAALEPLAPPLGPARP